MANRFPPLGPEDPSQVATYELRARLGSGGMGNVYLSFSPGGYPLAIKIVKRAFADDPEFRRRFRREIAAAQRVQGYYTAPVRDAAPDDEIPWYATAYIAGPSLQAAVAEHGPFPIFSVYRLLAGAAEGIAAVHAAGLIHRDLKPANVLLADDGPRVIDFGVAQAESASRLTGTGIAVGTPAFMAPEQVRGKVSAATDVFALGHLALFAATGHTAFGEGNADVLFYRLLHEPPDLDGCPGELRDLIASCLAKDPAARPTVGEVTAYAGAALRGQMMRLVDRSWLPQPVEQSLVDYSVSNAPLRGPLTEPGIPVRRAAHAAVRTESPLRGLLRPVIVIPAALILAGGGVLGFLAGHAEGVSAAAATPPVPSSRVISPAASPLAASRSAAARVAASPSAASPPAASPSAPPATVSPGGQPTASTPTPNAPSPGSAVAVAQGHDYVQAYADYAFTMPGGSCRAAVNPSDVVLAGSAPFVDTVNDGSNGDMEINCTTPPQLSFSDNLAEVSGTPNASGCYHAIATAPMLGPVTFQLLHPGSQFCLSTTSSSTKKTWLMWVTLKSMNSSSDDLTWTATAWYDDGSAS